MDRYAEMPNLQASVEVLTATATGPAQDQARTLRYEAPNKFRVESKGSQGSLVDAISDGSQEQDYDNLKLNNSQYKGKAPNSISEVTSNDMVDPSLCGSPLYLFFGGSKNFDHLVKGPVKEVAQSKGPDGEPVRIVQFDTPGLLGNVKAAIGEKHGFVYALNYDLSGAKDQIQARLNSVPKLKTDSHVGDQVKNLLSTRFTEGYMDIRVGGPLSRGSFDPEVPGAAAVASVANVPVPESTPIPLGTLAPDFTVQTLDGKTVTWKNLKGHPLMLDFWATWCGPCRLALPDTAEVQRAAKNGLIVLAITDEETPVIKTFLAKQSYKLTAYRDPGDKAQRAFQVGNLPSEVFIDSSGVVTKYLTGYHAAADVHLALKAIGIKS